MKTLLKGFDFKPDEMWAINPKSGRRDNAGYAAPFPIWWKRFNLCGSGLFVGEDNNQREFIEAKLRKEFMNIGHCYSADLYNADYSIDICSEALPSNKFDFIFCMAVLEHVFDPFSAIRNMSQSLNGSGEICISVPCNGFKQHRRPYDCYRFLEDAITKGFASVGNLILLDYAHCGWEWCAVYERRV